MEWLATQTFHHREFADFSALAMEKRAQGLRIAVCIPTLNEEATIGDVVSVLASSLGGPGGLVDELLVIDSGSQDRTLDIARSAGARVLEADEILPELGRRRGKGENLWKALFASSADILCYIDADIRNIHPRFVAGLVGPLLRHPHVGYVKGFYRRAGVETESGQPIGGGRVTEILVRPLFSLFAPELCAVIQPLAGEYAARRGVLEHLAFPVGYGVETAHLIDVVNRFGLNVLAQCDLEERVHRHRSNADLGRAAFGILQVFFSRIGGEEIRQILDRNARLHRLVLADEGGLRLEESTSHEEERPPMISIAAYRERERDRKEHGVTTPTSPA